MVDSASGIFLGVAGEPVLARDVAQYPFSILETIKGAESLEKVLIRRGVAKHAPDDERMPLSRHVALDFWRTGEGREYIRADCSLAVGFAKGRVYLIFEGIESRRAWERIIYVDDYWLNSVRRQAKGLKGPRIPVSLFVEQLDAVALFACPSKNARQLRLVDRVRGDIGFAVVPAPHDTRLRCVSENQKLLAVKESGNGMLRFFPLVNGQVDLSSDSLLRELLDLSKVQVEVFID